MALLTRRGVLRCGIAGGATVVMPTLASGQAASPDGQPLPHFFLLVVLGGGADASYMYDARPLSMSAAGRIQNYLGQEPALLQGRNGTTARTTSLVQPLARLQDRFSVLNGVVMTPSFDGHLQNMNYMLTGDAFGGESFVPHLNSDGDGAAAALLDAVVPGSPLFSNASNNARVVPLQPQTVGVLAQQLRNLTPMRRDDELGAFIRSRMQAAAKGTGRFSAGARAMLAGADAADEMHQRLARLQSPDPSWTADEQAIALVGQCFRLGIARSAVCVLPENFDVHSPDLAQKQPQIFASAVERIATLFDGLIETPYDDKRALIDVTTVMVASEFSRTLRSQDAPISYTGTHHNQFANTILLGGKGIRANMIVGATDLADENSQPSPAHLALDPRLEKAMGRPFDFATLQPRSDLPGRFEISDYLTIGSVVNTVYALFGVPQARWRRLGRDLPVAPILQNMRA